MILSPIRFCEKCDVKCSSKSAYDRHILTAKHIDANKKIAGLVFDCSFCNYHCKKLSDWNKHISTKKHINNSKNVVETKEYTCLVCQKKYNKYVSWWHHSKKCNDHTTNNINFAIYDKDNTNINDVGMDLDFVKQILEQNSELRNLLISQSEKIMEHGNILTELKTKQNVVVNNTLNNNTNRFNINVFLNEQCKDAMNLMDFVKNIQITNADIENNGQLGFVGGISKIFLDNLKQLSVYERPIHCTDAKRETMYIRSDDKWQKEEDNTKLQKAITEISRKSVEKINKWKTETPEYENMDSPEFMRGIVMSKNSMAGYNRETYADKIIKMLAKETIIEKNLPLLC